MMWNDHIRSCCSLAPYQRSGHTVTGPIDARERREAGGRQIWTSGGPTLKDLIGSGEGAELAPKPHKRSSKSRQPKAPKRKKTIRQPRLGENPKRW
jgi:hypothetical protein